MTDLKLILVTSKEMRHLNCLASGEYPSLDGENSESFEPARKLVYVFKESCDTYFINHIE